MIEAETLSWAKIDTFSMIVIFVSVIGELKRAAGNAAPETGVPLVAGEYRDTPFLNYPPVQLPGKNLL